MIYLLLTLLVLAFAVFTNSLSAWLQRKRKFYDHLGPMAWNTHQFVIAPAWLVFFIMSTQIGNFADWPLPFGVPEIGWALALLAIILFLSAIRVLGYQALTNGNLFGVGPKHKVKHGIFQYIQHPIYDSYTLAYLAAAFITNNVAYIAVAGVLHILLVHIQARLEIVD